MGRLRLDTLTRRVAAVLEEVARTIMRGLFGASRQKRGGLTLLKGPSGRRLPSVPDTVTPLWQLVTAAVAATIGSSTQPPRPIPT